MSTAEPGVVELTTPEGVPVPFRVASIADRAGALFIDGIIQIGATIGIVLLFHWGGADLSGWQVAFGQLIAFLIRAFYFTWFELRWLGRTPGKRAVGIRVVDSRGGPLSADAILARNFMRELELWLPLGLLVAPEALWPDAAGWAQVAAGGWAFVLATIPLWNARRQRVGDLVAGTLVIVTPRPVLLGDVGARSAPAHVMFTAKQLDIYGIYELQVLEDVLHRLRSGQLAGADVEVVAAKIKSKIRWSQEGVRPEVFLEDFYAALRARLEARMLLGKRKADKYAR